MKLKKLLLLLVGMFSIKTNAQSISFDNMYHLGESIQVKDAYSNYALTKRGMYLWIEKRDANGNYAPVYEKIINSAWSEGTINTNGGEIVAVIREHTSGLVIVSKQHGTVFDTLTITPDPNIEQQDIKAYRTSRGITFMYRYSLSIMAPNITKIGEVRFDGTVIKNIAPIDTLADYKALIADDNFNYLISHKPVHPEYLYIEKRGIDNALSFVSKDSVSLPITATTPIPTQIRNITQNDSIIRILIYSDEKEITILEYNKGTSSWEKRGISCSNVNYKQSYVFNEIITSGEKAYRLNSMTDPHPIVYDSLSYPQQDPMNFIAFPVSKHFFIWTTTTYLTALGPATIILLDQHLTQKDQEFISVPYRGIELLGSSMVNDSVFVLYGNTWQDTTGDRKAKIWSFSLKNVTTSIEQINNEKNPSILLYPNPSQDIIHITTHDQSKITGVIVRNIQGSVMKSMTTNEPSMNIHIEDYPAGLYTVEITTNNGTSFKKLIKQ